MFLTIIDGDNGDYLITYKGNDLFLAINKMDLIKFSTIIEFNEKISLVDIQNLLRKNIIISGFKNQIVLKNNKYQNEFNKIESLFICENDEQYLIKYKKNVIILNKIEIIKNEEEYILNAILKILDIENINFTVELDYDDYYFDDGSSYSEGYLLKINDLDYNLLKACAEYNNSVHYDLLYLVRYFLSIVNKNKIINVFHNYI